MTGMSDAARAVEAVLFAAAEPMTPEEIQAHVGEGLPVEIALGELGAFAITPTGIGGPALRVWGLRAGGMPWRALIVRSISHGLVTLLTPTYPAVGPSSRVDPPSSGVNERSFRQVFTRRGDRRQCRSPGH